MRVYSSCFTCFIVRYLVLSEITYGSGGATTETSSVSTTGLTTYTSTFDPEEECSVPKILECEGIPTSQTEANVSCIILTSSCYPQTLQINCTNEETTENITQTKSFFEQITNLNSVLNNLTETTNYTCEAYVTNSAGSTSDGFIFEFTLIANSEESSTPASTCTVPATPECTNLTVEETEANVSCIIEHSSCYPLTLVIDCSDDEGVAENASQTEEILEDQTNSTIRFQNLTEITNYTCNAYVINSAGYYSENFNFDFTSEGTAPLPPECTIPEEQPKCEIISSNLTGANISCNVEDQQNCTSAEIHLFCDDPLLNLTQHINQSSVIDIHLTNLFKCANYTCQIFISNPAGHSNSTYISFITDDDVEPPSDIKFDLESNNITWDHVVVAERVKQYWVSIQVLGKVQDSHYIDEKCLPPLVEMLYSTTNRYYVFDDALSDFRYNVSIFAETCARNGSNVDKIFETSPAASEPPQNVNTSLGETELNTNILINSTVNWTMPCNTNGPSDYFSVSIKGIYTEDNTLIDTKTCNITSTNNTKHYNCTLTDLSASTWYYGNISLVGAQIIGQPANFSFQTPDNYPANPEITILETTEYTFNVSWKKPANRPGEILNYTMIVTSEGPKYAPVSNCKYYNGTSYYVTNGDTFNQSFHEGYPYFNYVVNVRANTSRGIGNSSRVNITTNGTAPYNVENVAQVTQVISPTTDIEEYNVNAIVTFTPTCFVNGENFTIRFNYTGIRPGYDNLCGIETVRYKNSFIVSLQPEYTYNFNILSRNEYGENSTDTKMFTAPSGVPKIAESVASEIQTGENQVTLTLEKSSFDNSRGEVKYLAIIVSSENVTGGEFNRWNNVTWPEPKSDASTYYQATKKFWNPFLDKDKVTFVLGNDSDCTDEKYCNRPLSSGTQYYVIIRVFTTHFYRNNWPISLETESTLNVKLIVGLIIGLGGLAASSFLVFFLWRKGVIKNFVQKQTEEPVREIPVKKFVKYCQQLEEHPDKLKSQYTELCDETKQICEKMETIFARKLENKQKNRYVNILPFDHTRVKLNIDEDDEICTDYINASYIKGYSGEPEYIATQGPLPHTCRDFWKMILQENVTIIVMVSRFIENNKEKCYKYFPKNHENMQVGNDIEVRCCSELDFGIYSVRTLQVKKDLKQLSVTHMQFLEWPDFGVPSDTENMLQFCHQLQEKWKYEGGLAVVHCSAGVGRTGTLIAMDILLRAIKAGKKSINVYNTVLELRKQRINMVQTEKQYMYIHSLIKSIIQYPINTEEYTEEHFYENIDLKNNLQDNLLDQNIVETPL